MKAKAYDIDPMLTDEMDAEKLEDRASALRKVSSFLHNFISYPATFSN